jgi:D-cysteine desulfhydrase
MIDIINTQLRIFRDDLFPFLGGGNKGRKMLAIAKEIEKENYNAIITTGGVQSNHCRAVAIYAALKKIPCTLVLHGEKQRLEKESGNAKIIRLSDATVLFANDSSQIGSLMNQSMTEYQTRGLKPYYIWGGGHTTSGGYAYIEAIRELNECREKYNWQPDYIFLASGTGSTHAGILAGLDKYNFTKTEVIGISVARQSLSGSKIVTDFYEELCQYFDINCCNRNVILDDSYLCGGYEQYNDELKLLSLNSIKNYGFILDTTYSGKAFYGMSEYLKTIQHRKNILFWHTGGIFNFFAE